jgi:hypothetical protein
MSRSNPPQVSPSAEARVHWFPDRERFSICRRRRRKAIGCWTREIQAADEGRGLGGAVHAVHADVLPLDRERAAVADVVEGDDDVLELDVAATGRAEIPEPAGVAEVGVAAEDAHRAVAVAPPHVLHVDVIDAVGELADEPDIIHALVAEVRGIVVETETLVVADGRQRALGGGDVEGDLGRMHFEREVHVTLSKASRIGSQRLAKSLKPFS